MRATRVLSNSRVHLAVACARAHPLDFTIQYPVRREYFREHFVAKAIEAHKHIALLPALSTPLPSPLGLYVHVPFCAAKCYYCNFAVDTRATQDTHSSYVSILTRQLAALQASLSLNPNHVIYGIDIGGGTPTLISTELLKSILKSLEPFRERCTATHAISIETTPAIAGSQPEKLIALHAMGVSRVSVGIQSTHADTLSDLNRTKQIDTARAAIDNLLQAGFPRVSADILFGLPGQTLDAWLADVKWVASSGVDAITTYDCLYRGKGRALTRMGPARPSSLDYGTLYDAAYAELTSRGFHAPYGSLNFSRHAGETGVSAYFEGRMLHGRPYVGVGNYASSLVGRHWAFAPHAADEWMHASQMLEQRAMAPGGLSTLSSASPVPSVAAGLERLVHVSTTPLPLPAAAVYDLPPEERMAKFVLAALSFGHVPRNAFREAFGCEIGDVFPDSIEYAVRNGLLCVDEAKDTILISQGKFAEMPLIRALFYPMSALQWFSNLSLHGPKPRQPRKHI